MGYLLLPGLFPVAFDLSLTYKFFRYLANQNEASVFQNIEKSLDVLDEIIGSDNDNGAGAFIEMAFRAI